MMKRGMMAVYSYNKVANWLSELVVDIFYLFLLIISPLILVVALIKDFIERRIN